MRCWKQDDRSGKEGRGARVQWRLRTGMIRERNGDWDDSGEDCDDL